MVAKFVVSLFAFLWLGLSTHAADIRRIGDEEEDAYAELLVIHVDGPIVEGVLHKLGYVISNHQGTRVTAIEFRSHGGDVDEAIKIGRYIRDKGFYTTVHDYVILLVFLVLLVVHIGLLILMRANLVCISFMTEQ